MEVKKIEKEVIELSEEERNILNDASRIIEQLKVCTYYNEMIIILNGNEMTYVPDEFTYIIDILKRLSKVDNVEIRS